MTRTRSSVSRVSVRFADTVENPTRLSTSARSAEPVDSPSRTAKRAVGSHGSRQPTESSTGTVELPVDNNRDSNSLAVIYEDQPRMQSVYDAKSPAPCITTSSFYSAMTPGITTNLAKRFEALNQFEGGNDSEESRSPYVLQSGLRLSGDEATLDFSSKAGSRKSQSDARHSQSGARNSQSGARKSQRFSGKSRRSSRRSDLIFVPCPYEDDEGSIHSHIEDQKGGRDSRAPQHIEPQGCLAPDPRRSASPPDVDIIPQSEHSSERDKDISIASDASSFGFPEDPDRITHSKTSHPQFITHKVFGSLVHQSYGRDVYIASAKTFLGNVPLWLEQRPCDMKRVQEICEAKNEQPLFPGVISVFEFPVTFVPSLTTPQTRAIFDGQHRCLALHSMLECGIVTDMALIVEVFNVTSRQQIIDLYIEINKSQPVQEIDVPDAIASGKKRCIDEACSELAQRYAKCISTTPACRPPNVHLPSLRSRLFRSQVIDRRNLRSPAELLSVLLGINEELASRPEWPARQGRALKKAQANGFFLGMTQGWLEEL